MYEVVVAGRTERSLRAALADLVDEWERNADGDMTAHITDQSRLVAVVERVHELGASIEQVRQLR